VVLGKIALICYTTTAQTQDYAGLDALA